MVKIRKALLRGMEETTSKYKNQKVTLNGIKFDSKKEARRYYELKLLERAGIIKELKLQVPYVLIEKSKHGREIKYLADFTYIEKGKLIVEDVKSSATKTPLYKLKKRLLAERYDIEIKEVWLWKKR